MLSAHDVVHISGTIVVRESDGEPLMVIEMMSGAGVLLGLLVVEPPDDEDA